MSGECVTVRATRAGSPSRSLTTRTVLATGDLVRSTLYNQSEVARVTAMQATERVRAGRHGVRAVSSTALETPEITGVVSEAVRGEGAILLKRVRPALHDKDATPRGARPRDIVARAIFANGRAAARFTWMHASRAGFAKRFRDFRLCKARGSSIERPDSRHLPQLQMGGM